MQPSPPAFSRAPADATRRRIIRLGFAGLGVAGAGLLGCSRPTETPTPAPAPAPAPAPVTPPATESSPSTSTGATTPSAATPPNSGETPKGAVTAAMAQKVDENSPLAQSLSYKHDGNAVQNPKRLSGQFCDNCQFYAVANEQGGWAPCPVFQGNLVAAKGWCASWVKKA